MGSDSRDPEGGERSDRTRGARSAPLDLSH